MIKRVLLFIILIAVRTTSAQTTDPPPQVAQMGRGAASALDWHPDGAVLAVGGKLGVWLYDENLDDRGHFEEAGDVDGLVWSPDGTQMATSDNQVLTVWAVDGADFTPRWSRTIDMESDWLRFAWSPSGDRIAVWSFDGAVILDSDDGATRLEIPDLSAPLAWHPDGTQVAGGLDLGNEVGRSIRVWDAESGHTVNTYDTSDPNIYWSVIQWRPDGSELVALTAYPSMLYAWHTDTGEQSNEPDATETLVYVDMWWPSDSQRPITASRSTHHARIFLAVWDAADWTQTDQGVSLRSVQRMAKHPDEDMWAVLTHGGQLLLQGLEAPDPLRMRSVHSQPSRLLAWSPDMRFLAAATRSIDIWNPSQPHAPRSTPALVPYEEWHLDEIRWHTERDSLIGFVSHPGITAPGAYPTAFVFEWDRETGKLLGELHETPGSIAHDGSGSYLPRHVWNDDFSRVATILADHPVTISTTTPDNLSPFSPDREIAAIALADHLQQVAWSPDSAMLGIVTRDPQGETAAFVYDAQTGVLVNRLRPSFASTIQDIVWRPNSRQVALLGSRGVGGSGETEYRLDVLEIDREANETVTVMTILDTDQPPHTAWHPDNALIAVTESSGIAIYHVAETNDPQPITVIPEVVAHSLAWSDDGRWLAAGVADGTVRVWDVSGV